MDRGRSSLSDLVLMAQFFACYLHVVGVIFTFISKRELESDALPEKMTPRFQVVQKLEPGDAGADIDSLDIRLELPSQRLCAPGNQRQESQLTRLLSPQPPPPLPPMTAQLSHVPQLEPATWLPPESHLPCEQLYGFALRPPPLASTQLYRHYVDVGRKAGVYATPPVRLNMSRASLKRRKAGVKPEVSNGRVFSSFTLPRSFHSSSAVDSSCLASPEWQHTLSRPAARTLEGEADLDTYREYLRRGREPPTVPLASARLYASYVSQQYHMENLTGRLLPDSTHEDCANEGIWVKRADISSSSKGSDSFSNPVYDSPWSVKSDTTI